MKVLYILRLQDAVYEAKRKKKLVFLLIYILRSFKSPSCETQWLG